MENLKTLLSSLPQVTLSPEGVFKYILIEAKYKGETVEFVRGDASCEYHSDNFDKFVKEFDQKKFQIDGLTLRANENISIKCPGGGRVKHSGSFLLTKLQPRPFLSMATPNLMGRVITTTWQTS
jgi:hypothetical protein